MNGALLRSILLCRGLFEAPAERTPLAGRGTRSGEVKAECDNIDFYHQPDWKRDARIFRSIPVYTKSATVKTPRLSPSINHLYPFQTPNSYMRFLTLPLTGNRSFISASSVAKTDVVAVGVILSSPSPPKLSLFPCDRAGYFLNSFLAR